MPPCHRPLLAGVLTFVAAGLGAQDAVDAAASRRPDDLPALRVATFNIRYGTAPDGENAWPHRAANVVTTIRDWEAHVVGIQEALHFQVEQLRGALPGMGFVGQGRDGGDRGEHAGILFDTARLELVRHGDFWLSETPDVVASVGWDAALTRMVTWAVFRDRTTNTWFRVWNTHFDHRGEEARTRSGALLGHRVRRSPLPDLVLGDLNATEDSPAVEALRAAGLRDTWRERHPDSTASGTFGGFRGIVDDRKIDYVLADDGFVTRAATIDRRSFDGRDPSDHFPVTAAVTFARPGPQPLVPAAQVPDSIVLATRPELGVLAADRAAIAGHAAWRDAADGWRIAARITGTAVGDVVHTWCGESMLQQLWPAEGIALRASRRAGEHLIGAETLGAPAVVGVGVDGTGYRMLVPTAAPGRDGHALSLLTSADGKDFARHSDACGYSAVLQRRSAPRWPAVLARESDFVVHWTDTDGTVRAATTTDFRRFGEPIAVGAPPARSAQVVVRDGLAYLFVTPADPGATRTEVLASADPLDFDGARKVAELPWADVRAVDDRGTTFATWSDGERIYAAPLHWCAAEAD